MKTSRELFARRRSRTRVALRKTSSGRPRLSVHRSLQHTYAQVIDDAQGHTLAAASTLDAGIKAFKSTGNSAAAAEVGKLVASGQRPMVLMPLYLTVVVLFSMAV